jgi:hypothetical protein
MVQMGMSKEYRNLFGSHVGRVHYTGSGIEKNSLIPGFDKHTRSTPAEFDHTFSFSGDRAPRAQYCYSHSLIHGDHTETKIKQQFPENLLFIIA